MNEWRSEPCIYPEKEGSKQGEQPGSRPWSLKAPGTFREREGGPYGRSTVRRKQCGEGGQEGNTERGASRWLRAWLILRGKVPGMFREDEWQERLPTFIPLLCLLGYKRTRGRRRECLGEHEIMGVKVKGGLNSGGSNVSSENERTSLWTRYGILKSKRSSYSN